jgi:hypothetical protein
MASKLFKSFNLSDLCDVQEKLKLAETLTGGYAQLASHVLMVSNILD